MKLLLWCIALLPFVLAEEQNYNRKLKREYYKQNDVNSLAYNGPFGGGGCRKRHPENRSLLGGAEACHSHKPLKIKGISKMGKRLCSEGYEYCSLSHKSLHHLSWKPETMPKSCFAFHYKKDKFAGYGHNCHRNQYYDGLLCCPKTTHKTEHNNLRVGSSKKNNQLDYARKHINENFVKK